MKERRKEPTAREVWEHGPSVCSDPARCHVCGFLSQQMIDGIRGCLGKEPLYDNPVRSRRMVSSGRATHRLGDDAHSQPS
jgi:hypothetical protein